MPYDPDDLYTAEPKLLSLDCFPVFFVQPAAPPDYDLIMAGNTRYHRISEDNRASMESSNPELDAGLLLLDPTRDDDGNPPPKKSYNFSYHPTLLFRFIAICLFIPSFAMLVVTDRPRNLSAIIFICISFVRNILVILHWICSKRLRIRFSIELRNRGPVVGKPKRGCPAWLKHGLLHILIDFILVVVTLITTIIANSGANNWYWRSRHNGLVLPACVLSYIGNAFYLLSFIDLGKPNSITINSGIVFDYGKGNDDDQPSQPPQPQFYRDVEAAGGLGADSRKTGADSPVII
ncbi:uncharacterized protein LY89DRAFT_721182 [Mollisia scopiformis]|uniref:Uncharacterized protein n=1 Tax=Mollisia scopiformis TaxID=149040 RepID=A0A194X1I2_MOLSC|nr:uncharacterized protein LY89DRAFT_721182 [Mollisia scopiformis]KUJ14053.1 hypothetical protein LY89DRAFT_721182 [Mollisia scopiformis]